MYPSDIIETWGKIILAVLFFIGSFGVAMHACFSRRLSFFDFKAGDTSNKKGIKRIVIPLIIVAVLCAMMPIIIVYSQDLLGYLRDPDLGDYVKPPWNYIMPVIAMEVSMITCAFIGSFFYFGVGFTLWFILKLKK